MGSDRVRDETYLGSESYNGVNGRGVKRVGTIPPYTYRVSMKRLRDTVPVDSITDLL